MEKLTNKSCIDFAEVLASKQSVPGGGGAAALVGALGIALCSMVGNFTTGKMKYADVEEDIQAMLAKGETLRLRLLELVEEDAAAFEPLSKAYAIPKDDPTRDEVLDRVTLTACKAPVEMVERCAEAIALLEEMGQKGSRMLISDVGCGALFSRAAMESAAMNVYINTGSLKDRVSAKEIEAKVGALLDEYLPRAEKTAALVMKMIKKEDN